jgi:GNAT superfamily N-acetyltransferase
MHAEIRIRRAREEDALELSALAESTFRAAFAELNTAANMELHCATAYGHAVQLAEIRDAARETWIAETGVGMVAYVQLRFDAATPKITGERPVEIQRFYVDASQHGAGLAHQLMAHVVARAERAGSAVLWLGVWERNPRAMAFYRKWEFQVVAAHVFMFGSEPQRDLLMRRELLRGIDARHHVSSAQVLAHTDGAGPVGDELDLRGGRRPRSTTDAIRHPLNRRPSVRAPAPSIGRSRRAPLPGPPPCIDRLRCRAN